MFLSSLQVRTTALPRGFGASLVSLRTDMQCWCRLRSVRVSIPNSVLRSSRSDTPHDGLQATEKPLRRRALSQDPTVATCKAEWFAQVACAICDKCGSKRNNRLCAQRQYHRLWCSSTHGPGTCSKRKLLLDIDRRPIHGKLYSDDAFQAQSYMEWLDRRNCAPWSN
jgi:hypothetical protein